MQGAHERLRTVSAVVWLGVGCGGQTATSALSSTSSGATSFAATSVSGSTASSMTSTSSSAAPLFCSTPLDCDDFQDVFASCCIQGACLYGQAALAWICADAGPQILTASDYDQSCQNDSDCVSIAEGNFCDPPPWSGCPNAAINQSALAQYQADQAAIWQFPGSVCLAGQGCVGEGEPCCRSGVCSVECENVSVGDASADAESLSALGAGDASVEDAAGDEAGDTGAE